MVNQINITTNKKIQKILDSVVKKSGFRNYIIEEIQEGGKNNGYLSNIAEVKILIENGLNQTKPFDVVIKLAPNNAAVRFQITTPIFFSREIYAYNTIFRLLEDFEKQKNLVPSAFVPKFYEGDTTDGEEMLVLENLCTQGFKLYDQKIPMDHEHVSLILTTLGRLHAISFAIKDQRPKTFETFYETLFENWVDFLKKSKFDYFFVTAWKTCLEKLSLKLPKEHFNICQRFVETIPQVINELLPVVDDHCVIIHGDSRTNNYMFEYQEDASKPKSVKMLDLQICRLASPAIDLSYFIYFCCSNEVLDHLDDYLHLYHSSLSSHLEKLGSDAEKLFPFSVLKKQWKKYAVVGLMVSVSFLPVLFSENDETPDILKVVGSGKSLGSAFMETISDDYFHCDRIMHIITHFITNKFIE